METIIILDDGETFEGNFEQFSNCFFNLSGYETEEEAIEVIKDWCVTNGTGMEMKMEVVKR